MWYYILNTDLQICRTWDLVVYTLNTDPQICHTWDHVVFPLNTDLQICRTRDLVVYTLNTDPQICRTRDLGGLSSEYRPTDPSNLETLFSHPVPAFRSRSRTIAQLLGFSYLHEYS